MKMLVSIRNFTGSDSENRVTKAGVKLQFNLTLVALIARIRT
jgi:hypothetical protein